MNAAHSNSERAGEFRLTPEAFGGYLRRCGFVGDVEPVAIRQLGGGVSNEVLFVEGPQGRWVAKQSLGKLRVEEDWRSSRERVFREADAIASLGSILGDAVPQVVHVDRENFLYIMTAAPEGSRTWKDWLLDGRIDATIAARVGSLLAEILQASRANPDLRERFEDRAVFDELRIDPYYRTVALRHPDVAEVVEKLIEDSWNIRTALVHGDYSPKNMLVSDGQVFLIDFEVVHWGDPSFDAAFLLNHLMLKAFYRPWDAGLYFQAAREFWRALAAGSGELLDAGFEAMTVRHLGGLMLARIDGKSPVEYLRDAETRERVRKVAKPLLCEPPGTLQEGLEFVAKGIVQK